MAVQVGTDVVIDDNKNLTNIAGANGRYDSFYPNVTSPTPSSTLNISMDTPMYNLNMTGATTFTVTDKGVGKTNILLLDTETSGFAPSFDSAVVWAGDTEPTWADHRFWTIGLVSWDTTAVRATAAGFDS